VAHTLPVHRETVLITTQLGIGREGRVEGSHLKTAMVCSESSWACGLDISHWSCEKPSESSRWLGVGAWVMTHGSEDLFRGNG
jgi:hypothetical protein